MSEHTSTRRFGAVMAEKAEAEKAEAEAAKYAPPPLWRRLIGWNSLGVLIVVVAVVIALSNVLSIQAQFGAPHKRVVRLMHWQLELGYRDALAKVIADYNELQRARYEAGTQNHQIEVVQLPVTEKVFSQVLKVNLIAGTAPDIFTHFGNVELSRDCANINSYISEPNPYNSSEFLAGSGIDPSLAAKLPAMSWKDSYIDGMVGGFNRDRQTQYGIPVSFTLAGRFAYNRDLIKEITGEERIPETFGDLLKLGEQTRAFAKRSGRQLWPIAASRYNAGYFNSDLAGVMLQPWRRLLDADGDGDVSDTEGWAGIATGKVSWKDRTFSQYLDAAQAVSKEFATGFSSIDRDGGMYLFVQQKAPVFFCASWDAGTVTKLAKGRFRSTFGSIPVPGPGEPWNDPPRKPTSEAGIISWGAYHINRDGKVAEAIDFMRYLTSWKVNQQFNRAADWIPAILGTSPSTEMAAFAPRVAGVTPGWTPGSPWGSQLGGRVNLTLQGQMAGLTTGEVTRDAFIAKVDQIYADPNYGADTIWSRDFVNNRATSRTQDRPIAILGALAAARGERLDPAVLRDLLWGQIPLHNGQRVRWQHRKTIGADVEGKPGKPFPEVEP